MVLLTSAEGRTNESSVRTLWSGSNLGNKVAVVERYVSIAFLSVLHVRIMLCVFQCTRSVSLSSDSQCHSALSHYSNCNKYLLSLHWTGTLVSGQGWFVGVEIREWKLGKGQWVAWPQINLSNLSKLHVFAFLAWSRSVWVSAEINTGFLSRSATCKQSIQMSHVAVVIVVQRPLWSWQRSLVCIFQVSHTNLFLGICLRNWCLWLLATVEIKTNFTKVGRGITAASWKRTESEGLQATGLWIIITSVIMKGHNKAQLGQGAAKSLTACTRQGNVLISMGVIMHHVMNDYEKRSWFVLPTHLWLTTV